MLAHFAPTSQDSFYSSATALYLRRTGAPRYREVQARALLPAIASYRMEPKG